MKYLSSLVAFVVVGSAVVAPRVEAHCQIPCGIYGDATRFELMREHVTTIEKSMTEVVRLGKLEQPNDNQVVRWVSNKESHADALAEIVTSYFMAQRVKPVAATATAAHKKYVTELSLLHRLLVLSMKSKQTTDVAVCAELRTAIDSFEVSYMGKASHGH